MIQTGTERPEVRKSSLVVISLYQPADSQYKDEIESKNQVIYRCSVKPWTPCANVYALKTRPSSIDRIVLILPCVASKLFVRWKQPPTLDPGSRDPDSGAPSGHRDFTRLSMESLVDRACRCFLCSCLGISHAGFSCRECGGLRSCVWHVSHFLDRLLGYRAVPPCSGHRQTGYLKRLNRPSDNRPELSGFANRLFVWSLS